MNFLLAVAAFSMVYVVGVPGVAPDGPVTLADVAQSSPAQAAGLQSGDVIVAVDGQSVTVQTFREQTQSHLDRPMQVEVRRGDQQQGQTFTTVLTPRSSPPEGQGAIGIVISGGLIHLSPGAAVSQGFMQTVRAIGATLSVPKMLLEGTLAPGDARLIGLVGMAQATSETVTYVVDTGFWYPLFLLTGLFSAGLSIANMLPIPALDGGRLFFVILEWIRGRRIPPEREAAYHFVGIVLLLTLMVIISFNDVISPPQPINWGGR
jgi:regulator of sigma E protease